VLLERCLLFHGVPASALVQGTQEDMQEAREKGGQRVRGDTHGVRGVSTQSSLETKSKRCR